MENKFIKDTLLMKNEQLQLYESDKIRVKVSAKWAFIKFHPCEPSYILGGCQGACCRSKRGLIAVTEAEAQKLTDFIKTSSLFKNARIKNRFIAHLDNDDRCPFQDRNNYLCLLHRTKLKPIGCLVSPFTLTGSTLIVKFRNIHLKCYRDRSEEINKKVETFKAHRTSLEIIFGKEQAAYICDKLEKYRVDVWANMPVAIYNALRSNDLYRAMYKKSKE